MLSRDSTGPHVVVGIDGSACSLEALAWAVRFARSTHGRITAISAWQYPYVASLDTPTYLEIPRACRQTLDAAVAASDAAPDLPVMAKAPEGSPDDVLVQQSRDADLLVVGAHGHHGLVGLLLGSVSQHCVTKAACPVVVVRGSRAAAGATGRDHASAADSSR